MKTWTIRRRLLGCFAVILGLMLVMGGIAWTRLATIEQGAASAAKDSIPGLDLSNEIAGDLIMAYALTVEQLGQGDILATQKLAELK